MIGLHPSHMALREKVVAAIFILGVASISFALYDNRRSTYTAGKRIRLSSTPSFSVLYRYIQVSTIVSALGGCIFYDKLFLDIHDNTAIFYCGVAITALGILLFCHSKLALGKNYSPCFDSYLPHDLTTTGIYRYVRHPIYASNLLLLLGAFVMSGSAWLIINLIIAGCYYCYAAMKEESDLSLHIPGYAEYRTQSGKFFPKFF